MDELVPIPAGAYAVVFSSRRTAVDDGYEATADTMFELAAGADGFLGVESARGADGLGITVSYWTDEAAIAAWKADADHLLAQQRGRRDWYDRYEVRVCRVERTYGFGSGTIGG